MSGRGDNNKHGTSGQGASNQSNQPFVADGQDELKSNHNKHQTGGEPSIPQAKTVDQSANRNTHLVDDPQVKLPAEG
ncbi:hypothetical protein FC093_00085 [Ilyomonas limi]|uniref:Uncharacterized protein n=1 Tax=Ilyomonas limi TaxID=2575867 RepID=A0A4U3LAK0_9BACT|nr:hypothetical protein [Ilyomonas limi]TKK71464.1 hypothetical protein FC093_00085 [Ilyomonas limi]